MEFETVDRCGRIHVVKNGVESAEFVMPSFDGYTVFAPEPWGGWKTLDGALEGIAQLYMDTWYTVSEAAARLVEMGVFDAPPATQSVSTWARAGRFPGAVKVRGRGARGSGGSWRISEAGLIEFAERRKKQ